MSRSLEKLISWQEVAFSGVMDESEPQAEEEQRVSRIMSEAEDPDYWFAASKDGNREGHYRGGPTALRSHRQGFWLLEIRLRWASVLKQ
jgi:hypothetical protein